MRVSIIPYVQGRNDRPDGDGLKYGIAIHNTSNDASDTGEASYATRRTDNIGSHFYVDVDSVTQSIDTRDQVNHAGSAYGNQNAVCVEITGSNGKSRAWWLANVNWTLLGRVLAQVIRHHWPDGSFQVRRASVAEMKANPRVKAFYSHDDMRQAWGGTTHTDPGPGFPWDKLFASVNAGLKEYPMAGEFTPEDGRRLWANSNRILAILSNAAVAEYTMPGETSERRETNELATQLRLILRQTQSNGTAIGKLAGPDVDALADALTAALEPRLQSMVQAAAEAGAEAALRRVLGSLKVAP